MVDTRDARPHGAPTGLDWAAQLGVQLCRQERWEAGLALLTRAVDAESRQRELPSVVYSYLGYGIAHRHGEAEHGLALCRHAVRLDPRAPENHANLARVLVLTGRRARAVQVLDRALWRAPANPLLDGLRRDLGLRRRPTIRLLPRAHALNRTLGRMRHLLAPDRWTRPRGRRGWSTG